MKKISIFIVVCVMVLTLFVGCTPAVDQNIPADSSVASEGTEQAAQSAGETIKIRMTGWQPEAEWQAFLDYLNEVAAENNIEFEYQFIANDSYTNTLNTQLAANEGPDLMVLGSQLPAVVAAGHALDITDEEFPYAFQDSALSAVTISGKLYSVPTAASFGGIFYNKAIFEENGIEVPETWDELMAVGDKLDGTGIKPMVSGIKSYGISVWPAFGVLDNEFFATDAAEGFDDKINSGEVSMLELWSEPLNTYWYQLFEKGYITEDMVGLDDELALNEFVNGNYAMYPGGNWLNASIESKNPDMEYGMMPYPSTSGEGEGWLVGGPGSSIAINAGSENKEACMLLLKAVASEEGQKVLAECYQGPSMLKGIEYELPAVYEDCVDAINAGNLYVPSLWLSYSSLCEEIGRSTQLIATGSSTVDEMLMRMDELNQAIVSGQ